MIALRRLPLNLVPMTKTQLPVEQILTPADTLPVAPV